MYDRDFWQGLQHTFAHNFIAIWAWFNPFQLNVAFNRETSHLIWYVNQVTGSNMKIAMVWDGLMFSWVEAWFCMSDS